MNITVFISLLFTLQLLYWIIGRRSSTNLSTKENYFLAGKQVSFFPLMMTFLAAQVGGGLFLGSANEAYQFGWSVLLYPLGASLGLLLLGAGIGRKLAEFQVSTIAQLMEVVYRSPLLKKITSILSIVSLFMIFVAQIIASHKFLVSIGFSNMPLFIVFWAIVILYTVQGGLKAVISTDIIQAVFFSIVIFICFGFVCYSSSSISFSFDQIETIMPISSKLCGWLLMPLLFMIIEQDMAQRCFAAKTPRIASKASLFAGIFAMCICSIPVFFGVLAKNIGLIVPQGSSVLMSFIAQTTTPLITALLGCAILAAIISTASSLINAISSNLSSDFSWRLFQSKSPIRFIQIITAIFSIGAIFFAFYFDNIVDLLIQSYELAVSCLFVPIIFAIFKKEGNFISALVAILIGAICFFLFRVFPIAFPKEIASVLLSLLGYTTTELILWSRNWVPIHEK
ncbi:MAG: sodium:solute symporter family protein [Chlamydiales bacterium]|nr:sodium:solute symporter family protein [Chlamydiales bacterium]